MDTPTTVRKLRPPHNPTPRLLGRKKTLFMTDKDLRGEEDILVGISALDDASISDLRLIPKSVRKQQDIAKSSTPRRSLRFHQPTASTSPTSRNMYHDNKDKENVSFDNQMSESEEDLEELFSNSMRFSSLDSLNNFKDAPQVEDADNKETHRYTLKRSHILARSKLVPCSQNKVARVMSPNKSLCISTKAFYSTAKTTAKSINRLNHNTANLRKLSSINRSPSRIRRKDSRSGKNIINKGVKHMIRKPNRPGFYGPRAFTTLDVDNILSKLQNEKLKNLISTKRAEREQIEKVHSIFRSNNNPIEMARPLSVLHDMDDANNNEKNAQTYTYKHDTNNASMEADFSDIDEYGEGNDNLISALPGNHDIEEEIIPLITHNIKPNIAKAYSNEMEEPKAPLTNKKFFKSGLATNTKKEVKITDHIRASVCNGKISLLQKDNRLHKKIRKTASNGFSVEQATVDQILKDLDDHSFIEQQVEKALKSDRSHIAAISPMKIKSLEQHQNAVGIKPVQTINECGEVMGGFAFSDYRNRLPYNTSDPELIDQQQLLLDFLISNNICTEHNFKVFISDPDNHKEEAARIVDQVVEIVNDETNFRKRIPYNTTDPELISQQNSFLDFLIENKICNEENFDIFIANYENRYQEAEEIACKITKSFPDHLSVEHDRIENNNKRSDKISTHLPDSSDGNANPTANNSVSVVPPNNLFPIFYRGRCQPLSGTLRQSSRKLWTGGVGSNQYQIDVGQKNFGAHQCNQCGLVYTVHEPEEEKLHRDFHSSLHVLKFKGWIDEDIVAVYPEWGPDGRILRVTESSNNKRRERLMDILKIVDKELGFSSYIMPKMFVAYLAVRKCQIVGICLVQPIEKANKYVNQNGVDCCTEEEFEAKCGVSRIWVSPLHRRLHIASKLIQAVQINTIFREEITLDKIAFSAPTENGKFFAQKVTGLENFLVYH